MHPHERENRKIVDRFIEDNELIKSFNELRDDIDTHRFILGANTSAMIEAASTGKKIYELAELKDKKMEFEGIDTIQIEDLDLILSNKMMKPTIVLEKIFGSTKICLRGI